MSHEVSPKSCQAGAFDKYADAFESVNGMEIVDALQLLEKQNRRAADFLGRDLEQLKDGNFTKISADARNHMGTTALHVAARGGRVDFIEALIKAKADVNAKNKWQSTPLHLAADNNHLKAVEALLLAGADVQAKNVDGKTPLDLAKKYNHSAVVKLLEAARKWWTWCAQRWIWPRKLSK